MLLDVPSSLGGLLSLFAGCFTRPTFETFCALCVGSLRRVGPRTVTGMLAGCGLAGVWHHSRAHRFFSRARWSSDALGLVMLELIVSRFLAAGEPLCVAIDATLLRRFGPRVFARYLFRDGSLPGRCISYGNSWVVAGVIVSLPVLERQVCLPVLFRLWRPGEGPTEPQLARELVSVIAARYPERRVQVLGDGAYAAQALSPALLPANVSLILRTRRDTRLALPAPPRQPGRVGRPRLKGEQLPALETLAQHPCRWRTVALPRRQGIARLEVITQHGLWWRRWREVPVSVVAIRDPNAPGQIQAVLITNDTQLTPAQIIELYTRRWTIEVAFRDAKQLGGVGDAENRTRQAVERTAPFTFLCLTLAIIWYALHGHSPDDIHEHRQRAPWYRTKRQPSTQDMLAKLRRTIIATQISNAPAPTQNPPKTPDLHQLWELISA